MPRYRNSRGMHGMTLIELMIVVAVLGILIAIAYPSYREHIVKTRRADAQGALMGLANAMERHYTENSTYCGAAVAGGTDACGDGGDKDTGAPDIFPTEAPIDGDDKYYNLTINAASATSYTLRATPKGDQSGDGYLELTSTGARAWDENADGDTADTNEDNWEVD